MVPAEQPMRVGVEINQINAREALQPAARHHPAGATANQQQMPRRRLGGIQPIGDTPRGVAPLAAAPECAYMPAQAAGGVERFRQACLASWF